MILTGRNEKMRQDIVNRFRELNIPLPNYGLHLFPGGNQGISIYKSKVIEDSIEKNDWEEIHYFEDREDWLNQAATTISEKFPNVKFHKHHIMDIKSKLTL